MTIDPKYKKPELPGTIDELIINQFGLEQYNALLKALIQVQNPPIVLKANVIQPISEGEKDMKDKKPSLGMEVMDTDNINMIDIYNVIQIVESMEKRIAELQEKLDIIEKILFKDKK